MTNKIWIEKEFEEKMQQYIDKIYYSIFLGLDKINRSKRDNNDNERIFFMDKELCIDTHLTFNDASVLTGQEKTLRASKQHYNHFTFEYYNDPTLKTPGEWFKLAAQFYFFGYANEGESDYLDWWLIDVLKLRLFLTNNVGIDILLNKYRHNNKGLAKADFFGIPFELLENENGIILLNKKIYEG